MTKEQFVAQAIAHVRGLGVGGDIRYLYTEVAEIIAAIPEAPKASKVRELVSRAEEVARQYRDVVASREAFEAQMRAARKAAYCRHGNYIGDPYGPDYMCGRCESGDD